MILLTYLPLIVLIVGLILYIVATDKPKASECGRIMFWTGLFWTLAPYAGKVAF